MKLSTVEHKKLFRASSIEPENTYVIFREDTFISLMSFDKDVKIEQQYNYLQAILTALNSCG